MRPISLRHIAGSDCGGYLICELPSNFRDFTWSKFSGHNRPLIEEELQREVVSQAASDEAPAKKPVTAEEKPVKKTARLFKGRRPADENGATVSGGRLFEV